MTRHQVRPLTPHSHQPPQRHLHREQRRLGITRLLEQPPASGTSPNATSRNDRPATGSKNPHTSSKAAANTPDR